MAKNKAGRNHIAPIIEPVCIPAKSVLAPDAKKPLTMSLNTTPVTSAMDLLLNGVSWILGLCGVGNDIVPALPTAIMKPLSGSGARGMMIDAMKTLGPDSFAGRLSCMFQGAADTTFYIIAVYFGSVGVKKTRHAVTCALIADAAGVIAAIAIAYLFFPPN